MSRIIVPACTFLLLLWVSHIRAEEVKNSSYTELGVTVGLILHPSVGYWWDRKGIRISGMYLNTSHAEYHLNFAYALRDTQKVQHSVNLLTSWIVGSDPGADYNYAATGLAYSINYNGFFVELGLGWPWRDDIGNLANNPVVPIGYLGYIHRFKQK